MSSKLSPSAKHIGSSLQSTLVRGYKVFGLFALVAILFGLVCFLTVNIFYMFNDSWIRPVILEPAHERVVSANTAVNDELHRREEAVQRRMELELDSQMIDKTLAEAAAFEADYEQVAGKNDADTFQALSARRELAEVRLEKHRMGSRKDFIAERIAALDSNIARFDHSLAEMRKSPFFRANDEEIHVAFVPYENLEEVDAGESVYGCRWGLLFCSQVGKIGQRLPGEVTHEHPEGGQSLRGVMVELELRKDWAAEENALFVGSKPLWIL